MSLSHIEPNPLRPLQAAQAEADKALLRNVGLSQTPRTTQIDPVVFGASATSPQAQEILLERILSRVEIEPDLDEAMFLSTGRASFEARASEATDTSPEGTAGRIVEGVTGYIFDAFAARHTDMTEDQVLDFREQVMRGFEIGLQDAKDILTGLRALTPELSASIDQTESLVREQLAGFFQSLLDTTLPAGGEV